jgi:hypothetical protein
VVNGGEGVWGYAMCERHSQRSISFVVRCSFALLVPVTLISYYIRFYLLLLRLPGFRRSVSTYVRCTHYNFEL